MRVKFGTNSVERLTVCRSVNSWVCERDNAETQQDRQMKFGTRARNCTFVPNFLLNWPKERGPSACSILFTGLRKGSGGQVVRSRLRGRKFQGSRPVSTEDRCVWGVLHIQSYVRGK
ncbi:hypothetical protein AVEN_215493-1 [Araneus ventricosus]|uniref:Uncharacterized protein n=1 Tax=Araneus ventricosus TaxID=182803 RepID=A0A4Y2PUS6_ARAVE|nr:hypothetical protein AVEN_215493-1 [Araneus ventricosus]